MGDLATSIARIKPLPDAVVDAATALNAAMRAAEHGLSVRLEVNESPTGPDAEPVPTVRSRISKRTV